MSKWIIILALTLAALPLLVKPVRSAEFLANEKNVTVTSKENAKDLYVISDSVTVESPVGGDLVAAGSSLLLNGAVENSLFAVGANLTIRSNTGHHLRAAGGDVIISSRTEGDAFVAGGTVTLSKEATINGGLYAAGNTVTVNGSVRGQTRIAGDTVTLSGNLGNVYVIANKLIVRSNAVISGDLSYRAPTQATIEDGAQIDGATNFTEAPVTNFSPLGTLQTVQFWLTLIGSILLGLLLLYIFPSITRRSVVENGASRFGFSALIGVAVLLLTPLLLLLLAFTVVGLPAAILIGAFYLTILLIGSLVGKIMFGTLIWKLVKKHDSWQLDWQAVVIGIALLPFVALIPFIGWAVSFVFFVTGVGATVLLISGQATGGTDRYKPQLNSEAQ